MSLGEPRGVTIPDSRPLCLSLSQFHPHGNRDSISCVLDWLQPAKSTETGAEGRLPSRVPHGTGSGQVSAQRPPRRRGKGMADPAQRQNRPIHQLTRFPGERMQKTTFSPFPARVHNPARRKTQARQD